MLVFRGFVFCAALALLGCTQSAPSAPSSPVPTPVPLQVSATAPPAVTAEEFRKLRGEVLVLKHRLSSFEEGAATVSTEEEGFDVARTKFGPLTVSARGATPYLDGYKVKIRIGNLANANFNGAKLKLGWGPPWDSQKDLEEWSKAQKTKEMSLTTKLASGSFTDVDVVLTPARPEDIKSFTVGFELNQIELRVR